MFQPLRNESQRFLAECFKLNRPLVLVAFLLILSSLGLGCASENSDDPRPVVMVSVLPQKWIVDKLAEDFVQTHVMIPPGASPASHEPTIAQRKALADAAFYVIVGHPRFPFERSWLSGLQEEAPNLKLVDGSGDVPMLDSDPHLWVSPTYMLALANRVAFELKKLAPERESEIDENLKALTEEIETTDQIIRTALAKHKGASFLVYHAAWGYFASDYGLTQIPVERGAKQPGPAGLASVIDTAKEKGIRIVLVQPQFPSQAAETIAEQISGEVVLIDPLALDWGTNMRNVAKTFERVLKK